MTQRLSYPIEQQHYFSGFVLLPEEKAQWHEIDFAAVSAKKRDFEDIFIWALPQVSRDGFTYYNLENNGQASEEEDNMDAFYDERLPLALSENAIVSPEFSTHIVTSTSGHEFRNSNWADARMRYDVGPGIRSEDELGILIAFFRARHGPATAFRLRDPYDHSSNAMTGTPSSSDQLIGVGDGQTSTFQLVKNYGEQSRPITRPGAGSIQVNVGGADTTNWTLQDGGRIALTAAPADGAEVRAGFTFDVPVRFAEDRLDISGVDFAVGEAPSVPLIEVREAA